jgi:hypothetical protein
MIKMFVITHIKDFIDIHWFENYVLGCFEGVTQNYKNLNQVKYPH